MISYGHKGLIAAKDEMAGLVGTGLGSINGHQDREYGG